MILIRVLWRKIIMAGCSTLQLKITVAVLVLCSCSISANIQNPGGCSPAPPNDSLISSGSPGVLRSNNVPNILTSTGSKRVTLFRPVIGGHSTDPWAVFSETQVRQHGLWCQVQEANTNNMTDSNIGDWYYPTPNGFSLLPNMSNDGTPYQSLKCGNQVGLVVDGDIMNNQGIVRCTTYITGLTTLTLLNTDTNYLGVYEDSVITNIRDCEYMMLCIIKCLTALNFLTFHSWSSSRFYHNTPATSYKRCWSQCSV